MIHVLHLYKIAESLAGTVRCGQMPSMVTPLKLNTNKTLTKGCHGTVTSSVLLVHVLSDSALKPRPYRTWKNLTQHLKPYNKIVSPYR